MTARKKNSTALARAFLAAYRRSGDITVAAADVGMNRSSHYQWLRNSPAYKAVFERCRDQLGDMLEAVMLKRAREGVLEPVFYQGQPTGAIRRFDVGREMFLLRGLKRKVYGHKTELSGPEGGPIQTRIEVTFIDPSPGE